MPTDLLPLTPPVFHILVALVDDERHGYGIMQDVAQQTNDALQLGPGTLYGCLKRMLAAGLVEESDERPDPELDDARRRYYRITALGRRAVRAEAERLAGRGYGGSGSKTSWPYGGRKRVMLRLVAGAAVYADALRLPARIPPWVRRRNETTVSGLLARCGQGRELATRFYDSAFAALPIG